MTASNSVSLLKTVPYHFTSFCHALFLDPSLNISCILDEMILLCIITNYKVFWLELTEINIFFKKI